MNTNEPRRIPIHVAPMRPMLVMGGERALVMLTGLVAITFWLGFLRSFSFWPLTIGLLVWFGGLFLFKRTARNDPQMFAVMRRHMKYRAHYMARSTPWRDN